MTEATVWFGLTTFLGGSLLTGIAAYFTVMRSQLTKEAHAAICADKQQIVSVQLASINKTLQQHGEKLDRILLDGRKGGRD